MTCRIGDREFAPESRYLTLQLRESDPHDDPGTLRARLAEDGYLFIRGLHDRDEVLQGGDILERMAARGDLDPAAPLMDDVANPPLRPTSTSVRGTDDLKTPSLGKVLYGPRAMQFFERLLGSEPKAYNFQWLRAAGPGACSGIHSDVRAEHLYPPRLAHEHDQPLPPELRHAVPAEARAGRRSLERRGSARTRPFLAVRRRARARGGLAAALGRVSRARRHVA